MSGNKGWTEEFTPSLAQFAELEASDPNAFWRLECGHHLNLLDEARERIEALEAEREALKAEIVGPLEMTPARQAVMDRLLGEAKRADRVKALEAVASAAYVFVAANGRVVEPIAPQSLAALRDALSRLDGDT